VRTIKRLVIHCSATPNGRPHTVQDIDAWHRDNGWKRDPSAAKRCGNPELTSIGYTRVIYTNGESRQGRCWDEIPVSVRGWNSDAIAICMVGTNKFSLQQWDTLKREVSFVQSQLKIEIIQGHRDLSPDKDRDGFVEPHEWLKDCPGFDVAKWLAGGMEPLQGHIL
jgi:N-acetylmuramoyl-L-alanine amidase